MPHPSILPSSSPLPHALHDLLLDEIQAKIRSGDMRPLYWGPPELITVPIVKCRVCGRKRPDDGTPCVDPVCDTYYNEEIQQQYEKFKNVVALSRIKALRKLERDPENEHVRVRLDRLIEKNNFKGEK